MNMKNLLIAVTVMGIFSIGCSAPKDTRSVGAKDFMTVAKERHSTRLFSSKTVPQDTLNLILEAGRLAPTAKNNQPHTIYLIKSPEAIARLDQVTPCRYKAPHAFLICYDETKTYKKGDGRDSGDVDCSIVLTHMMLEAANLGVATVWVAMWDVNEMRKAFDIPANLHPVALMPFGYEAKLCPPSPRHNSRRPIEETVIEL